MTSRRNIANKVERLEEESDHPPEDTVILDIATIDHDGQWAIKTEAKYPELVVKPYPEKRPKVLDYTTPRFIPNQYLQEPFLTICSEETHDKHRLEPNGKDTVTVRTLWDSLSDDDLQREYEYRNSNGERIPDILANYE